MIILESTEIIIPYEPMDSPLVFIGGDMDASYGQTEEYNLLRPIYDRIDKYCKYGASSFCFSCTMFKMFETEQVRAIFKNNHLHRMEAQQRFSKFLSQGGK